MQIQFDIALRIVRAPSFLIVLCLVAGGCGQDDTSPETNLQDNTTASSILDKAFSGIGGRDRLQNLQTFYFESTRERWLLGEGPEPGIGLFRPVVSDVKVSHELDGNKIRLDYHHVNLYRYERDATELIIGESGYVLGMEDYYVKPPVLEAAMVPDRWASNNRTERLLNPHIPLRELLDDSSRISVGDAESGSEGLRLSGNHAYPVTLFLGEVSGQRSLLASAAWVDRWQDKPFYELTVNKDELHMDSDWFDEWQADRYPEEAAHHKLVVTDDIFPVTLYINKETGHISKLATMEHDMIWGDVALEVTYHDWESFSGIYFPERVKISVAGTPSLEVVRTRVDVNPVFDDAIFAAPEGVEYQHDETAAARGARVSQLLQAFAHAGAPKKPLSRPELVIKTIRDGFYLLDSIPSDTIYTLVVEQDNGVVVVEPGFQDLKGEAIIDWIAQDINKPITHIIATHHHVDHAGGIRPYAAAGARPVVHQAAEDYYNALFARVFTLLPDALERARIPVKVDAVAADGEYRIADPQRPVVVYPLVTRHTTDSVLVFIDVGDERFVYNGDLWAIGENLGETIQNSLDMHKAVMKRGIEVDYMIGSHLRVKDPVYVTYDHFKKIAHID